MKNRYNLKFILDRFKVGLTQIILDITDAHDSAINFNLHKIYVPQLIKQMEQII